jgi:dTDP-4-amino-4,6-dideoxygalactose transaminase
MSDLSAAFLFAQINDIKAVNNRRSEIFNNYYTALLNVVETQSSSSINSISNSHLFYLKTNRRKQLISYLHNKKIKAHFHYTPLHSSLAGKKYAYFLDKDIYTTVESERLLRLPLYTQLSLQNYIIEQVVNFFNEELT